MPPTVPHTPESCIMPNTINPRNKAEFRVPDRARETDEESGKDSDGESTKPGPGASTASGFGGLGLAGMVGRDDSAGEGDMSPPGVGNNGVISGDSAGAEARGASGNNAGAADMLENSIRIWDDKADEVTKQAIKAMRTTQNDQKEAII
ncbi:hypothetical protein SLE2022_206260 [Rubroshorea leprosula]